MALEINRGGVTGSSVLKAGILVAASVALLAPFGLLATTKAAHGAVLKIAETQPSAFLQLLLTLLLATIALLWSFKALLQMPPVLQRVRIHQGRVMCRDRTWYGERTWEQPLAAYRGLRHRVTTTSDGLRHELIMEHPCPRFGVLLHHGAKISENEVAEMARVLALRAL